MGSIATNDSFDYINDSKLLQNGRQSSGAENDSQHNFTANLSNESIEESRSSPIGISASTPPPLIPRRNKVFGFPPKLPPKPTPDLSSVKSSLNSRYSNGNSDSDKFE